MILVDTSVWIDYFNGTENWQTTYLDQALTELTVLMGDIILAELLQGFKKDLDYQQAKDALNHLECVVLGGKEIAVKSAINFRFLKSKGITIRKTVDMLIGTCCLESDIALLHNDRDFDQIARFLPLKIVEEKP